MLAACSNTATSKLLRLCLSGPAYANTACFLAMEIYPTRYSVPITRSMSLAVHCKAAIASYKTMLDLRAEPHRRVRRTTTIPASEHHGVVSSAAPAEDCHRRHQLMLAYHVLELYTGTSSCLDRLEPRYPQGAGLERRIVPTFWCRPKMYKAGTG